MDICATVADESFSKAGDKIREHYGVTIPVSSERAVTLSHAKIKWLHAQQQLLKCGRYEAALTNLRNYAHEHESSIKSGFNHTRAYGNMAFQQ